MQLNTPCRLIMLVFVAGLLHFPASAADAVSPATCAFTNIRDEGVVNASESAYYKGTSLLLTNCALYAGTSTNSARQGLSAVAIQLKVGNAVTSATYSGTAAVETNGTWWCLITVPTNPGSCYLQVKITDANTNIYIYPWKSLIRADPL